MGRVHLDRGLKQEGSVDNEEIVKLKALTSEGLRRHIEQLELSRIKLSPAQRGQIRSIVDQIKERRSSADHG
jgi:hypothetical protein